MKNLKLIFVSIIIAMLTLVSCTNEKAIIQQEEVVKSIAAKTSMQELSYHFNDDGTLSQNEGTTDNNPVGNILFDFCFEFEYPVTLSYNLGATVVINDFDELINVLINMTDDLYIDGIAFPFNVLVFNQASGAVELQTINNENGFVTLLDSCGFDEDDCVYTDDFDPVCIELQDPTGESFIVQFPNMSYAICEGFTQNDVVACDEVVDPGVDDNECFEFNYPISVVTLDGTTIVVQSDEEWETIMYTIQGFDFVYPFEVTLLDGGSVQTIATDIDFINLLDTCYDIDPVDPCYCSDEIVPVCVADPITGESIQYDNFCLAQCDGFSQNDMIDCGTFQDCSIDDIELTVGDCNDDGTYNLTINFNTDYSANEEFYLGFEMSYSSSGAFTVADLPLTINNVQVFDIESEWITISFSSECTEYSSFAMPNCEIPCWEFVYPVDIEVNGVVQIVNNNTELDVIITDPSVQYQPVYPFNVTINQTTQQIDTPNNFYEIGEWASMCN